MKSPLSFSPPRLTFLSLAAGLLLPLPARADIVVTTVTDENDTPAGAQISLREALRDSVSGEQITLDPALGFNSILVLTSGEIAVTGKTVSVNIPLGLTIEARGASRILRVAPDASLTLAGLTLQGGKAPPAEGGGAILNAGALTLNDCVLRDNRAADGAPGAKGSAGVAPAYFGDNFFTYSGHGQPGGTGGSGGAVSSSGSLTVTRCRFISNTAGNGGTGGDGGNVINSTSVFWAGGWGGWGGGGGSGGAISSSGSLQLTGSLFDSNTAGTGGTGGMEGFPLGPGGGGNLGYGGTSGPGGAVDHNGSMTVQRCTFIGNTAAPGGLPGPRGQLRGTAGSGSAFSWNNGTALLTNCIFTANRTGESAARDGGDFGGAFYAGNGTQLKFVHCTIAGNLGARFRQGAEFASWIPSDAAGIVTYGVTAQCENCIISGNLVDRTPDNTTPVWQEANFAPNTLRSVNPSAPLGGASGENAQLSPPGLPPGLQLPILLPGSGSPAINAGVTITNPPSTDLRGMQRFDGHPDLGAVEVQTVEATLLKPQAISFHPPALVEPVAMPYGLTLTASSSSQLPVTFELLSGPASLNGANLAINGFGFLTVRAVQQGNFATVPALSVVRVIEVSRLPQTIAFSPAASYRFYPQSPAVITLPSNTSAGLPVTWSTSGTVPAGVSLTGNQITASAAGSLQIRGQHAGDSQRKPVDTTWTLTFTQGTVWWETPAWPGGPGGSPIMFSLVEGSPYGLSMTATIPGPHSGAVSVPPLPGGLIATPSVIPAGQTSVICMVTLPANPALTNQSHTMPTSQTGLPNMTFVLANRNDAPLVISAPSRALAGTPVTVLVGSLSVLVPPPGTTGPPILFGGRTVSISAVDFDNPALTIPVTLDSQTFPTEPFAAGKSLQVTFRQTNRRAKLTVTTDDGLTGTFGPVQLLDDINADGDSINDLVEAALQRAPNQPHAPPLTLEKDTAGLHAVLGSRPLDLQGWSIIIELSSDLQTWTPAPAASITTTPNPDNTTERVSVLLPAGGVWFSRLRAVHP